MGMPILDCSEVLKKSKRRKKLYFFKCVVQNLKLGHIGSYSSGFSAGVLAGGVALEVPLESLVPP